MSNIFDSSHKSFAFFSHQKDVRKEVPVCMMSSNEEKNTERMSKTKESFTDLKKVVEMRAAKVKLTVATD